MLWAACPACSGKNATNNSSTTNTVNARERIRDHFLYPVGWWREGGAVTPQRSAPHSRHPNPAGGMPRQGEALAGWAIDYDVALLVAARSPPFASAGRIAAAR
jgi:hypothetical protein